MDSPLCQKHKKYCAKTVPKIDTKHLILRDGIYYYRQVVKINNCFKDIRRSLKTTNYKEAMHKLTNVERQFWLKKEIQQLEELVFDDSLSLQEKRELHIDRQRLQSELDQLEQKMKGHLAYPGKNNNIPNIQENQLSNDYVVMNTGYNSKQNIPTIQELLNDFGDANNIPQGKVSTYDREKKEKSKKIAKLNRMFEASNIGLTQPISVLDNPKIINDIIEQIKKYPQSSKSKQCIINVTVNKHITVLKQFLQHCSDISPMYIKRNTYTKIEKLPEKKSETVPHTPYSPEQLKKIFDPTNPKSCFRKKPYLFWAVLLSMCTGGRKNACTSLQFKDIKIINGIKSIVFIRDNDRIKHYKTEATDRKLPISNILLNLGFWEWVQNRKKYLQAQDTDVIFPECLVHKSDNPEHNGEYSQKCVNSFFTYLKNIGIKHQNKETARTNRSQYDFHSLRKTANIELTKNNIEPQYRNMILGWESSTNRENKMTEVVYSIDTYSDDVVKQLQPMVNKGFQYTELTEEFKQWKTIMKDTFKPKI